jgi:hypothetical protein
MTAETLRHPPPAKGLKHVRIPAVYAEHGFAMTPG